MSVLCQCLKDPFISGEVHILLVSLTTRRILENVKTMVLEFQAIAYFHSVYKITVK
jgi:hypothetical protein